MHTAALFLAFTLRAACDILDDKMNLAIPPGIIERSDELIKVLKSNNGESIENAIHALILAVANLTLNPTENFVCPLSRFIIYVSVLPSGKIEDPKGINATLTELKWPIRATMFWEIFQRSKDGNQEDTEL